MKFEIRNRWSGEVQVTAEIECAENAPISLKLGLAVKWAISHAANLTAANLTRANLTDANLTRANLTAANLTDANLTRANNMRLPTGELFSEYLAETMPALLIAGGKSLESFKDHWDCHDWDNCPMAHAFSVKKESDTPLLLRPRVSQFVQLFDGKQLKWEHVQAAIDARAK